MIFLTVRTEQPEAYMGVWDDGTALAEKTWTAHRELAASFYSTLEEVLVQSGKSREDLSGIICFEGPGSFTGLRIGISAANALAYVLNKPIVAAKGDNWISDGLKALQDGQDQKVVLPSYGAEANITLPKK